LKLLPPDLIFLCYRPNTPNSISAGAPPQTPLGSSQRSPRPLSWILGASFVSVHQGLQGLNPALLATVTSVMSLQERYGQGRNQDFLLTKAKPPLLPSYSSFPHLSLPFQGLAPLIQLWGVGSAVSSPSRSGRSPAAKWFMNNFELERVLLVITINYVQKLPSL